MRAIARAHVSTVALLLANGANPNFADKVTVTDPVTVQSVSFPTDTRARALYMFSSISGSLGGLCAIYYKFMYISFNLIYCNLDLFFRTRYGYVV